MSSQPNQSLADGLACLQELAISGEAIGCREMARRLGLHHVKTNRLLKGLVAAGMARQDEEARYLVGPALHVLGAVATFGSGLLQRALPAIQELINHSQCTVALGVRWRQHVCYVFHGGPNTDLQKAMGRTSLHPVNNSSVGQVILAHDETAEASNDQNRQELQAIKEQGYCCLRHGSPDKPHLSIAVPIGTPVFAGLACTTLPPDHSYDTLIEQMQRTAAELDHAHQH